LAIEKNYSVILTCLCVLLFFFGLGSRDFWAPVEPRYAEIARVMFAKGEWVVPTVNGDLYTDKPILYFWLVLLASKAAGAVNEWTVRLPVALGGLGFVLTTYFIGKEFYSARAGFLSAVILATSMRVIWESRWAHIDMLFGFFFTLSIYYAARWIFRRGHRYEIFLSYAMMGLATLAKGLIGVVLPALLLISFVLVRRDWQLLLEAKLPAGIALFLSLVVPWVWLVGRATDGKWLADFIYIHHIQRYLAGAGHRQPFYYYFATLPVDLLPWTVFVVPALYAYRNSRKIWREPVPLFFVLWFLTVFLFFSFSDTKRELYLVPLLPTVALLLGNYFNDLASGEIFETFLHRWLALGNFALITVLGIALPLAAWFVRRDAFWLSVPASLVLIAGGAFAVHCIRQRRPLWTVASIALMMTLGMMSAVQWFFPYLETFKSRRLFAREINKIVPLAEPLYVYADTMNDFNFYLRREVMPVLSSPADVEKLPSAAQTRYMLIKQRDLAKLNMIAPQRILLSDGAANATWNLIQVKMPVSQFR
jgi:4-amino-4-deoxy-L-arabinose transferase-like glycosyltransferase